MSKNLGVFLGREQFIEEMEIYKLIIWKIYNILKING